MESLMSYKELSRVPGLRLFTGEGKQDAASGSFSSVAIDSRSVVQGALFIALKGAANDGHRFLEAAFIAGASGAMVSFSALENPDLGVSALAKKYNRVLVAAPDTLKGFQNAATAYLKGFPALVRIGITGSVGKTTTKEIAAAMIAQEKRVVMNEGNLNSETGLPLSVFNVRASHEYGVFEAGINHPGEMLDLAKILNPRIALITNIGSAHIGILGSRQAIAEEKKKFFSEFDGSNTAMIPMDDDFRDFLAKDVSGKIVFYRGSSLPPFGGARDLGLLGTEIIWDGVPVRFALPGKFNLNNALTAAALAMELNLSSSSIRGGFESVKPIFGRMEIFRGRVTLVRDCYNANPEGVEAALDFFDPIEWQGRKVFVMGSMLEMGAQSDEVHTILGKRLASCKGDMFFLYGEEMRAAADILKAEKIPFLHTQDMGELSAALDAYLKKGDLVLLKGSRAYAMEELTGVITGPGAEHVS